jgi:endonuclease/exonuclease/phosphatase family metal-dependent hydrolase
MSIQFRNFLVSTLALACCSAHAQKLSVATYNIRLYNAGDTQKGNGWEVRAPVVAGLVRFHDFDIWGGQEVVHNQLEDLLAALPEYAHIGVGRDDGKTKGEYSPVFYKRDRFELLQNGNFWLSEDTDTPNKGWDAECIRICSWGQFKDKEGGKPFWVFNLHMDHVGVVARAESAKLVMNKIRSMSCGEPTILMGDFNDNVDSPILVDEGGMLTSRDALKANPLCLFNLSSDIPVNQRGTYYWYTGRVWNSLDSISVSPGLLDAARGVWTIQEGSYSIFKYPAHLDNNRPKSFRLFRPRDGGESYWIHGYSDHFPVTVTLERKE